jgi:hypothetical protein
MKFIKTLGLEYAFYLYLIACASWFVLRVYGVAIPGYAILALPLLPAFLLLRVKATWDTSCWEEPVRAVSGNRGRIGRFGKLHHGLGDRGSEAVAFFTQAANTQSILSASSVPIQSS